MFGCMPLLLLRVSLHLQYRLLERSMKKEFKAYTGQVTDIDLRQFRIFKMVVDCGGFAAAEVALNISRPAISMAVSDLEARLKMTLCQRGRAGFFLTDEGRGIYEAIVQLFASMEVFKLQVNGLHSFLKGDLNIGISDNLVTLEHMNISKALASLKERGPDININIRMAPPIDIERGVMDGQLHVGVVPHARSLPNIEYFNLYDEESYLYCSNTHPLYNAETLSVEDVIAADMVVSTYGRTPSISGFTQSFHTTAQASDKEGIAFLVLTGAYIGFLPAHFAERWFEKGALKTLMPELFQYSTSYAAITRKGAKPNRIVDTLMKLLVND